MRARELEAAARAGEELPTADELEARTREALRQLWTQSRDGRAAFEARPSKVTMLRSLYTGQDTQPETDRLNEKAGPSMRGLLATSHWERLGACGADGCVVVPDFAHFMWDGVKVFAAPDLAYVQGGVLHVIDWKTGREDDSQALQVLLQMWWALETLPSWRGGRGRQPRDPRLPGVRDRRAARSRSRRRPASASRPPRPCAPASPRCAPCWPTRSGTSRSRWRRSSAVRAGSAAAATSLLRCARSPGAGQRDAGGPSALVEHAPALAASKAATAAARAAASPPPPGSFGSSGSNGSNDARIASSSEQARPPHLAGAVVVDVEHGRRTERPHDAPWSPP